MFEILEHLPYKSIRQVIIYFFSSFFRNNLTIIDAYVLQGQGGRGELKLNNKKPGASTLQFDIAEKHLKNCDSK